MTMSLRTRLTLAIVLVTGPFVAMLVASLYLAVSAAVWADFDRETRATAQIFASLVEWDEEDGHELEGGDAIAGLLRADVSPIYVEIRAADAVLLADPALTDRDRQALRTWPEDQIVDLTADLRGVRIFTAPRTDPGVVAPAVAVEIVTVRETAATRATLSRLATWFWLLGAGAIVLAALAAAAAVHRGMVPVRELARRLDRVVDPADPLDLPISAVPRELQPVVRRLDALLARLRVSFARERRFTADVAHELRTPLSVLRAEIDVALQRELGPDEYRARLAGLRATTDRMCAMIESLLLLSRADGGHLEVERTSIPLGPLIAECWAPFAAVAASRGLRFTSEIADDASVDADEAKLRMIVGNLLANAAEYTATDGEIRVVQAPDGDAVLTVVDSGPPIQDDHLPRLFDPFWRADPARSEAGLHCGIGLALARALARCQGFDVVVDNQPDGSVAATITRRARQPAMGVVPFDSGMRPLHRGFMFLC
jgi:signal transduction histidine kinase